MDNMLASIVKCIWQYACKHIVKCICYISESFLLTCTRCWPRIASVSRMRWEREMWSTRVWKLATLLKQQTIWSCCIATPVDFRLGDCGTITIKCASTWEAQHSKIRVLSTHLVGRCPWRHKHWSELFSASHCAHHNSFHFLTLLTKIEGPQKGTCCCSIIHFLKHFQP